MASDAFRVANAFQQVSQLAVAQGHVRLLGGGGLAETGDLSLTFFPHPFLPMICCPALCRHGSRGVCREGAEGYAGGLGAPPVWQRH